MDYSTEFFLALVGFGLITSFLMEGWLQSRPLLFWKRGWACNAVHIGIYMFGLGSLLLIMQRVTIAVLVLFLVQFIVVAVNNVKERTLREPFLSCDFEYFTDAIKHPRLYLPFFGYTKATLLIITGLAVMTALMYLRKPVTELHDSLQEVLLAELLLILVSGFMVWLAGKNLPPQTLEPLADLKRCGLLGFLYAYRQLEHRVNIVGGQPFAMLSNFVQPDQSLIRDLVSIQAESFFDPRMTFPCLKKELLPNWDRLCSESLSCGSLDTGPWGANTVRPEFEFLTGLSSAQIGVHQFQPYRKLARQPLPSLARWLKTLGYQTIAIHPYQKHFYSRHKVYPNLGFDEFIDIDAFKNAKCAGGYVSDAALGEFVANLLARPCDQPRYIHVITMENHGPYDISTGLDDTVDPFTHPIPERCAEFGVYARHLQNSDKLFGLIAEALDKQKRPGALCIFGDHVPILNKTYEALGYPDGHTNFLIWDAANKKHGTTDAPLSVEVLAEKFLNEVGVSSPNRASRNV